MTTARVLVNLGLGMAFTAVYAWCYEAYLYPNFGYLGFDFYPRSTLFIATSFLIAMLPALCYRGVRAVSSVLTVLIYLVLYIPIIITFSLASQKPADEIVAVQLTFLLGMVMIFFADLAVIRNPFRLRYRRDLMPLVGVLTILSIAYLLVIYRGNLHLPSFGEDLYTTRLDNAALGAGLVTPYLSTWLLTVWVPLSLAHGLTNRKPLYSIAAVIACFVLYITSANKFSILLPFGVIGFYYFARRSLSAIFPKFTVVLSLAIVVMVIASKFSTVVMLGSSIILMRTIGNGGQLTVAYYDFFTTHPQTDYSHVNGIKLFVHRYPYGNLGIGDVVGQYFWTPFMNANANFWATDGVAAMGLLGVVLASVMCVLVFIAMNSVTRDRDRLFSVICFLPFLSMVLNQSLFSSIWSGGALFLLMFLSFSKPYDVADHVADDVSPIGPLAIDG